MRSELIKALENIELRLTQTRLASQIGKQSKQRRIDFLLDQMEQIGADARRAIDIAEGDEGIVVPA